MAEVTRTSLIRRVRDPSDARSWAEFRELYEPLLVRYIRSRGLSESDASDVAQDVFVTLLRALPRFELDHSRGRFRTWLWQVTMNAIADWGRRNRRQSRAEDEWRRRGGGAEVQPESQADADWITAHRQRVLDYVLAQVKTEAQPKTWACFEQHILKGRPTADVGAEVGLTANAVCVNASRILARVRERCAEYMEDLDAGEHPVPGGP
jgi:RNA polymerase sigma-70 factor (ECF subfamily)